MSTIEALNANTQLSPVRVVAAANQSGTYFNGPLNNGVGATFTYATGVLTIDSVNVNLNDFVLLAGQSLPYQNGIYQCIVQGAVGVAAVLQRRGDFQNIEQIRTGQYVPVEAGTALGGSIWSVVEPLPSAIGVPIVSGANNIVFVNAGSESSGMFLQIANDLSDVASPSTSLSNLGGLSLAGGQMTGSVLLDRGIATSTAGAATINNQAGVVTTEALTTASGSAYSFALTNSRITASSIVLCQLMGGTNTKHGLSFTAVPSNGSAAISVLNNDISAAALNGTLIFGFVVI